MRLKQLRANKPSFQTVTFNPEGISIIPAKKKTDDPTNTTNSVGKSFSLYLVHFCLGANSTPSFKKQLKSWVFSLDFYLNDEVWSVSRSVNEDQKIVLTGGGK
jgi:uncharacterized protein YydD (DUF2326 family)